MNLGVASVRDDDMGRAYEYLIKRFADKANKKAGEFYTPRTIVRLMVNILDQKLVRVSTIPPVVLVVCCLKLSTM